MINNPDVALAAFNEYMRGLRSRIRPAPAGVLRARSRQSGQSRRRRRVIDLFRLQAVICDSGGRIHSSALVDPERALFRAERDGLYVGPGYVGELILDLGEDICPYALVLKSQDDQGRLVFPAELTPPERLAARQTQDAALAQANDLDIIIARPVNAVVRLGDQQEARPDPDPANPDEDPQDGRIYIEDWFLLLYSRDIYFPCFLRTLEACDLPLRQFVRDELENPQFVWQNIIDRFLQVYCPAVNQRYEFTSEDTGRGQARNLWACIEDVARASQNEFERRVWLRQIRRENRSSTMRRIQTTMTSIEIIAIGRRTSTTHPVTRVLVHYNRYNVTHIPGRPAGNQPEPEQGPVRHRRRVNGRAAL
ncbi:hypothetical protein BCR43DRAFT_118543 [Syncephalastrum racemosum]|uniref:Uncharacterized protein n=1 Tax=Syncephalastrum racemosum TaxID=13706 RepID=A0A1X2GZE9_SYNRA|nr:hypothetical protein BCR43DRAFT_118543 [Syncephalastrum racemosum]